MTRDSDTRAPAAPGGGPARPGRRRDRSRDGAILDATLDVLAEAGFARLTMDAVAARAGAGKATLYRRWPSKTELVVDAVARMKREQVDTGSLPDTGDLREDLLGLFRPQSAREGERRLRIMAGLASMLVQDEASADAVSAAIVQPWTEAHRFLMRRAVERGEASAAADVDTLSQVVASMAAYRALVQRRPFDRDFLVSLVDGVLIPALRGPRAETPSAEPERTS
ncbi:TetR/AcrR family transcriptional regulator [Nocardiopsis dassonvillei]|uniref:TetR/AcrR family transcriptional regulator n=1 Tax=Nocardiopsis dassonvillei TaxID=2014 RepID=UPI00366DDECD